MSGVMKNIRIDWEEAIGRLLLHHRDYVSGLDETGRNSGIGPVIRGGERDGATELR